MPPVADVINKKYGSNTISLASKITERVPILLDSGVLSLNLALGTNGFLGGRMGMVWGEKQSGKTILSLCFAARVQQDGGKVAFLDAEGTLDISFATKLGVDPSKLFVVTSKSERKNAKGEKMDPLYGEEWFAILIELIKSGEYNLIILDSLPALIPKSKMEVEAVDSSKQKAVPASMMADFIPKVNAHLNMNPNCFVYLISQERSNVMVTHGSTRKAFGGNTSGFFITYEIYCRKCESFRQRVNITPTKTVEEEVAIRVQYRVTKNKVARLTEPAEFIIDLSTGVDVFDDTLNVSKALGVVALSGSTFSFDGKKAAGFEKFKELVMKNPEMLEKIRAQCMKTLTERDRSGYTLADNQEAPEGSNGMGDK
jgi:recombination protein RecA